MRKGDFGLKVLPGKELDNGLVVVTHAQQYRLRLSNYNLKLSCDAVVEIDGKFMGRFRINSYSSITIERPTHDNGMFTFYRHGSIEAKRAGLSGNMIEGMISITFIAEAPERLCDLDICYMLVSTGGTGLSGVSDDEYKSVDELDLNDKSRVQITTRLVCYDGPRPLI